MYEYARAFVFFNAKPQLLEKASLQAQPIRFTVRHGMNKSNQCVFCPGHVPDVAQVIPPSMVQLMQLFCLLSLMTMVSLRLRHANMNPQAPHSTTMLLVVGSCGQRSSTAGAGCTRGLQTLTRSARGLRQQQDCTMLSNVSGSYLNHQNPITTEKELFFFKLIRRNASLRSIVYSFARLACWVLDPTICKLTHSMLMVESIDFENKALSLSLSLSLSFSCIVKVHTRGRSGPDLVT